MFFSSRQSVIILILLAPLGFLCFGSSVTPQDKPEKPTEDPFFLVLPYLQLPTQETMTVMWETSHPLPGRVEFGTTPNLGQTADSAGEKVLHEVKLQGLKTGITYHYRVRCGKLVSEVFTFKTAPSPETKRWRMAVYGDSRLNPQVHRQVAEQIAKANVDLIVHTGDIVTNGKNHPSWRLEFFEPLGDLARSVPWVSTIGNHERDAENYFSYMALPGNEHYFAFDYANANIVCLDSNGWIEKGRDSKQYQWLTSHLGKKREATWTFVVFHHPLFSAHANRPINSLRWDWTPAFLEPMNKVDGVLTGHDHFYARNHRMGKLAESPQPGVLFLTSAGGGASLYRSKKRDYVAAEKSVHHFTLFDFDGDKIHLSAIDLTGKVFDRYEWTKDPTPPEEFCAYEVEELRSNLGKALAASKPIPLSLNGKTTINTVVEVPTRFQVPVKGQFRWRETPGWKLKNPIEKFHLKPREPLRVPLQAEVAGEMVVATPKLTVAFEEGRFANRFIDVYPFKLGGPETASVTRLKKALNVDGKLSETPWHKIPILPLLSLVPGEIAARKAGVQLAADSKRLYVGIRLDDPAGLVKVEEANADEEPSKFTLFGEHVRVDLWEGKKHLQFALSPEQIRYYSSGMKEDHPPPWEGRASHDRDAWTVELALPRTLFTDMDKVRINVVHHQRHGTGYLDAELCPSCGLGTNPDVIPDWKPVNNPDHYARLVVK